MGSYCMLYILNLLTILKDSSFLHGLLVIVNIIQVLYIYFKIMNLTGLVYVTLVSVMFFLYRFVFLIYEGQQSE